jgi:hypothetical protein
MNLHKTNQNWGKRMRKEKENGSEIESGKRASDTTIYQRLLQTVALPWLVLAFGPVKLWVTIVGWFLWTAVMMMLPKGAALVGIAVPIVMMMLSMAAGVLLLIDMERQRIAAKLPATNSSKN